MSKNVIYTGCYMDTAPKIRYCFGNWDIKNDDKRGIYMKPTAMSIHFETRDSNHEIADFICQKNNEPDSFCHLCPQVREDIVRELDRILAKAEPSLLVFRDEANAIQGVFRLIVESEEKYLELIWGFVRNLSIYDSLFAYFRREYPGFHLDAIVTKGNETMYEAYQSQGIRYDDEQILMTLDVYSPRPVDAAIVRYTPEYEASFRAIHDDEGVYWTAERMLKALDRYNVFVAVENEEAVGYIEVTTYDDENEPIQLWVKPDCRGKGYGRALLQTAIENNFPKKMILDVYANNTPALNLYLHLGFKEKLREFTGSMTV